jgi:hypothetical protein
MLRCQSPQGFVPLPPWWGKVGMGGEMAFFTPHLNPPPQGGRKNAITLSPLGEDWAEGEGLISGACRRQ